jgi:hypothetical protein
LNASIPILTLEKANTWAFAAGLAEIQLNVLRIAPVPVMEELAQYVSGLRQHSRIYEFQIKIFPYLTVKSTAYPDTSDRLALEAWLKDDKPMRVKSCTLGRYGTLAATQIAQVRSMLLNRNVTLARYEVSDEDGKTYERANLTLISRHYE